MNADNSSPSVISHAEVVKLLEAQTAAFEQRLTAQAEEFETKLAEVNNRYVAVSHQQAMAQKNTDGLQRNTQDLQQSTRGLQQSTHSLHRSNQAFVTTNKSLQRSAAKIIEVNDDIRTSLASIKAQIANSNVEFGRVLALLATGHANQGSATTPAVLQQLHVQHNNMRVLITELENQLKETNVRHVTEGSMACNCSHKTINDKLGKQSNRIIGLERRLAKLQRAFLVWKEDQQGTTSHNKSDDAKEDDIAVDDLNTEAADGGNAYAGSWRRAKKGTGSYQNHDERHHDPKGC